MYLNIRYENKNDGVNIWENRLTNVINTLKYTDCDIIGFQEMLFNQLEDITSSLYEYDWLGVGREDGDKKGEFSPVFYKKQRFQKLEYNNFWLSEYHDSSGVKGWEVAWERIVTWVKLKDKFNDKCVFVFNTHFDHYGEKARGESVNLLLSRIENIAGDNHVILMGDFNAHPNSSVIKEITNINRRNSVFDSKELTDIVFGPKWTFQDFGRRPMDRRPVIDYIFIKNGFLVNKYGVLNACIDSVYISDHNPVVVDLKYRDI